MRAREEVRRIVEPGGVVIEQPTGPRPATSSTVASIMSTAPLCIREDVLASDVATLLVEHGFGAVPVVDADGRAVGIVSKTDLLRHLHGSGSPDTKAADLMMPIVFAVDQRTLLGDAAALMAGEGVHRLPVIDSSGAVVGILSALDLVRWLGQLAGYTL